MLSGLVGPWAGQTIVLNAIEIGIGREVGQDIQLTGDATASRRHAALTLGPLGWTVRDLGSSNGTWVNGVRVQEQVLVPGDVLRVGQSEFRFEG
jgi:pSer/pThr/pTyr-binding forkhead associated (FHA) protein